MQTSYFVRHANFLDSFLIDLTGRNMSENTVSTYKSHLMKMITLIDKPLEDWTGVDFNKYLIDSEKEFNEQRKAAFEHEFQTEKYIYKRYSPRTKMLKANALRSFINFCLDENLITRSEMKFRKIKEPIEHRFKNRVELNEILAFIKSMKSKRHQMMFLFQFGMMLRISELIKVRFQDIKWNEGILIVKGKGNKTRSVPFDSTTKAILYDYICEYHFRIPVHKVNEYFQLKGRFRIPESAKPLYEMVRDKDPKLFTIGRFNIDSHVSKLGDDFVFRARGNKPYRGTAGLHGVLDLANKEGNFSKKITSHFFRGNGATIRSDNGAELAVLQMWLGHSSPSTTMIYVDISKKRLISSATETQFLPKTIT